MRVAPVEKHLARHTRLRERLRAEDLNALLVTSLPNLGYLTGLFASAGLLLVDANVIRLIVDGRYLDAAQTRHAELPGLEIHLVPASESFEEVTADLVRRLGHGRVGIEAGQMTVQQYDDLRRRVGTDGQNCDLVPTNGLVEILRAVKDSWELERIQDAAGRLSDAAKYTIPRALAGMAERDVAGNIEAELRRVGFERPAFDTIVASGPNSARPHHRTGNRRLEPGDLVVLDFGGMLDGYSVDISRTVVLGPAGERERRLIAQVVEAQSAAFGAVAVGRPASEIDRAARDVLVREGLGEAFTHGTGHGLGLEIHERPRVGRIRAGLPDEPLEAGMVFTLEPGAYVPGWGGARIEDDVVVTARGGQWLTDVPRML